MSDIIDKLHESKNKLLEGEAENLMYWKKLRHNKTDFELFLNNNIAEVWFKTKDGKEEQLICTSNTTLIKLFSTKKKEDKKKVAKLVSKGIHTIEMDSVLTWDLRANKFKTIYLKTWAILNFVTITKENIEILDQVVEDLLKT